MVRLCSQSSRSYSGRPATRACRQRRERRPAMTVAREQESAEAVVPRATSRGPTDGPPTKRPDGLTTREGLNLAGRTRPSLVLSRSDEADRLSYRAAIIVAEKECCSIRKDCQEPPYADPHVRWCVAPGKAQEQGKRKTETARTNSVGIKIPPGKVGHPRKRVLRSRP
jgi:hypothetical protein